jgi:hypothetical protein
LLKKEFLWTVPNDDNRAEDGRYLRYEFINQTGLQVSPEWMDLGCSMLELLIGLSRRLSFEADGEARVWFWDLIGNLGIAINDRHYNEREAARIDEVLENVIYRRYSRAGRGGLFPLVQAERDQRRMELWHQLNAYIMELE